ncbi:MAG: leucine--tRNA ligase [Pirellula sp.]|jgi:leucyl-tRNA synthetase
MPRYNPAVIEPKWQSFWESNKTFRCPEMPSGEKVYILDMFPYPSGAGLHVGHPEGYTATDITARFSRMKGKSVLHPMGYDAFGLPAEEYAIRTNTPPRVSTEQNIANFTRQLKMLGFSYDWDRCLATTDVAYFKWTQWIFLELYDTWFDESQNKGRPISELPIPADVQAQGEYAVSEYQDKHRLAYQDEALVNWCPGLGTVLANEEVIDGKSERGGHPVQRIPLRQWMLRITSYADRLLSDLDGLDWSPSIKKLQIDWIGRSTGAEVDFPVIASSEYEGWKAARKGKAFPAKQPENTIRVYTTRPDTLYGATYMVIAPEHPLVKQIVAPEQAAQVQSYCDAASFKSDRDRTDGDKKKTGVFTGAYAINPVTGNPVPIWVADYVLIGYGTGAIMAVPAHDDRDFEFAQAYSLPVTCVVRPSTETEGIENVYSGKVCYTGPGTAMNSGELDGLETEQAKAKIIDSLSAAGIAKQAVNCKLRDWLFSRQRFWGEPFPILHELDDAGNPTGRKRAVDRNQLPVDLPHLEDFKPHGRPEPPLAKADDSWLYVTIDGKRYRRETNTMPQWAGSCWYYLRFIDPTNSDALVDRAKEKAWMPVDLYIGGAEHAVLHLLYARFWHKVLYDRGHVSQPEPFQKLVNQGMILGEVEYTGYQTADKRWVSTSALMKGDDGLIEKSTKTPVTPVKVEDADVTKAGDSFVLVIDPSIRLESRAHKMSKARGNVINPDAVVSEYGADSLRLYEMFMGPLEATKPWSTKGVNGVRNFLDRVWRLMIDTHTDDNVLLDCIQDVEPTAEQNRVIHSTIMNVTRDIETLGFNTPIARMMEFVNFFTKEEVRPKKGMEALVLLLAPYAPHIAEELWQALGHSQTLAYEKWPEYDEQMIKMSEIEIPLQINGKIRAKIVVAADATQEQLEQAARNHERITELLEGKQIVKAIVVPGRMVNFVVK